MNTATKQRLHDICDGEIFQLADKDGKHCQLRIVHDPQSESPRQWTNFGKMACWHNRYSLGDEQPMIEPHEYVKEIYAEHGKNNVVILPLYLYDHGGLTMNTSGFFCPWDSGQVGYIYITKQDALSDMCANPRHWKAEAKKALESEVYLYDQYLQGCVYGFVLDAENDEEWEEIDSSWGFVGDTLEESGMLAYIENEYTIIEK